MNKQLEKKIEKVEGLKAKEVEKRMNNIIVALNEKELENAILNYDNLIKKMNNGNSSNNKKFNENLKKELEGLFNGN